MPALNDQTQRPVKLIYLGRQGAGKTGSFASLAAAGYKLRLLDADKGVDTLQNLLLDRDHFPYRNFMDKHNIDLGLSSFIPVDQEMNISTVDRAYKDPTGKVIKTTKERVLAPSNAQAWHKVTDLLQDWNDGGQKLGNVHSWGPDTICILDTYSTMARYAYYYHQGINGRLGAIEDGFDHQRDIGGAQAWLRRLLEVLFSSAVKCNIIVACHITWVDESRGFAQSPGEINRAGRSSDPDGLPDAIGQALSPRMGKYFNNVFAVRSSATGDSRKIWTKPIDRVICKRSAWLEDSYDITTGLAEIFSQLNGQPLPKDFIQDLKNVRPNGQDTPPIPTSSGVGRPQPLKL
jgi:hypothetical protein